LDQKQLDQALAIFEGFKNNLPPSISEDCVKEYHAVVDAIGLATGETQLHLFKIGDHELEHKVIGGQRMSFSGRPGHVIRSKEKRCDSTRFQRQIEALSHYLDSQGYRRSNRASPAPRTESRSSHSVHIENMFGSAIQQGTRDSQITVNFDAKGAEFKNLVNQIKEAIPKLNLDHERTNQLYADVGTIEVQVASPHPKQSIIAECVHSVRSILETVATKALTSGLLLAINKYFPQ
jgi:hypothetical protein